MAPARLKNGKYQPTSQYIMVYGKKRHVVLITKTMWIEKEEDGSLVFHLGELLVDGPKPHKRLDTPKPCSVCKLPCTDATPLGRARHPMCEGWLDVMPDHMQAQVLFGVARDLGAEVMT